MKKLVKPEVYDFENDAAVKALCESCDACHYSNVSCTSCNVCDHYADDDKNDEILF
jgi:hypothetical protein